jgi:hypothetical protein
MIRSAALTAALLAVAAAPALASGGPVAGTSVGPAGVTVPGAASRYTALSAHGGTLVAKVERRSGRVLASRFVAGRLVVPAVALDGSATGLSADRGTLVLASPRSVGRRHSAFVVFDAQRLAVLKRIRLDGDFTLDAMSPDGATLYLIESTSRRDLTRYRVRGYDVGAGRLLPGEIVDPEEADEPMRGNPVARTLSADGRWAYTLYDGAGGPHPFIHALDTVAGRAKCIDLDGLGSDEVYSMGLRIGRDGRLIVRPLDGGRAVLTVDPVTWAVRRPGSAPAAPAPAGAGRAGWLGPTLGIAILALLATFVVRAGRRERRGDLGQLRL